MQEFIERTFEGVKRNVSVNGLEGVEMERELEGHGVSGQGQYISLTIGTGAWVFGASYAARRFCCSTLLSWEASTDSRHYGTEKN